MDEVLGKEEWWKELQQRRRRGTAPRNVTDISTLFGTGPVDGFTGSFQQGSGTRRERWEIKLGRFVNRKKSHTMSGLSKLGMPFSMTMRANRLRGEVMTSESEMSDTDDEYNGASSSDESSSESAVSEGDLSDYHERDEPDDSQLMKRQRRASTGDALGQAMKKGARLHLHKAVIPPKSTKAPMPHPLPHPEATLEVPQATNPRLKRPDYIHRVSSPSFTSRPVPDTEISTSDDPNAPSIGFSAAPSTSTPPTHRKPSTSSPSSSTPPTAGPATTKAPRSSNLKEPPLTASTTTTPSPGRRVSPANVTISFNDLPSKAQHLILNELMRQYSASPNNTPTGYGNPSADGASPRGEVGETVVLFTTLPAPAAGTWRGLKESMEYLEGLELLTGGLPPTLLVHSNSLTVTTAL